MAAAAASSVAGSRATRIRSQPSSASTSAAARPMPFEPPVISARLPASFRSILRRLPVRSACDRPGTPRRTRGRSPDSLRCRHSPIPGAIAPRRRNRRAAARLTRRTRTASIVPSSAPRLDHQAGRRAVDRLAVQRVHHDGVGADDARQLAAERDRVLRAVALLDRAGAAAMVQPPVAARAPAGAACRRAPRSAPGCRGRSPAPACRGRSPRGSAAAWWRRGPDRAARASGFRRRRSGWGARCSGCRGSAGRRCGRAPPAAASPSGGIMIGSAPAPPSTATA